MRRAKLRSLSRMHISGFASLYRLRRRAIREADFDSTLSLDAGNAAPGLGAIGGDISMLIGIFPGLGSYWESQLVVNGDERIIRSYKLGPLIEAVIKELRDYEREYG